MDNLSWRQYAQMYLQYVAIKIAEQESKSWRIHSDQLRTEVPEQQCKFWFNVGGGFAL